ncbi:endolytic transglycosylase MltG [Glaciecola sp. SC05]|uniref:endolytic transglycosylase MltG n=1 Tax=Glaciecola sp. SC05 TaxID=1987355 RepID=UPI003528DFC9
MLKKCVIIFMGVMFLLSVGAYALFLQVNALGTQTINIQTPLIVHLKPGQSAQSIWRSLPVTHSELNHTYFKLWLKLYPENSRVKAGYYEFNSSQSLESIFEQISKGKETQFSIALVEGQTIRQWLSLLSATSTLKQDLPEFDLLYALVTETKTSQHTNFCENDMSSLEGCLLADTYFYSYQDSALSILRRAFNAMDTELDIAWSQRFQDIPLRSPYEALILASIIEKETAVASERGLIAGVFSNRLELNMRLQTDPTVIYGIGVDFDGNITRAHLREMTPFNTYRIKGLPPTPIAMAGRASLMAAVQPQITDYIYFVAKGDGSHQFSETLAQHNKAVAEYQLNR